MQNTPKHFQIYHQPVFRISSKVWSCWHLDGCWIYRKSHWWINLRALPIHIPHGLDHWSLLAEWDEFRFYLFSFKKTVFPKLLLDDKKLLLSMFQICRVPCLFCGWAGGETNELALKLLEGKYKKNNQRFWIFKVKLSSVAPTARQWVSSGRAGLP